MLGSQTAISASRLQRQAYFFAALTCRQEGLHAVNVSLEGGAASQLPAAMQQVEAELRAAEEAGEKVCMAG